MRSILKRGSQGYLVQEVQGTLDIRADGIFGRQTDDAVRKFQHSKGLRQDGIVGRKTWPEIEKQAAALRLTFADLRWVGTQRYNVWLIPQKKQWACWYAAGMMVRFWKRNLQQMSMAGAPAPSEIPQSVARHMADTGLTYAATKQHAIRMGLTWASRHNVTFTPGFIHNLLKQHGPLWTGGLNHVVVITGISQDGSQLFINDPAPVNRGSKYTRDMLWLNNFLPPRDETPLLFCP
jgi:lysozyme family protein